MIRIQVAIDLQECTLHLRSTQGVADELGGMRVVLDGKERIFSQFPNGVASATDPAAHGNYIGEMRVEQLERLVTYLQIFNWSVPGNEPSYNVRTRIECWRSSRLCISGDVLITTTADSFTSEQVSALGDMSLRAEREAVVNAHASQRIREKSTRVDPIAAAAWKQLGAFRLSYVKL